MPEPTRHRALGMALGVATLVATAAASGQVYKCTDAEGRTTYAGAPCSAASRPLKLPDDGREARTDPHMCAQLKDETQRLADEAERNAARGRAESAAGAKKRRALTAQYEARCVGIARVVPKPQ